MAESNNLTERKRIELRATPCNPICLVWLNRLGGWSQWVFEGRSQITREIARKKDYSTYETNYETSKGNRHGRGGTDEKRIKIGAYHLIENHFQGLLELVSSPKVYNVTTEGKIFEVTPSNLVQSFNVDDTLSSIELEVSFPNFNSQKV